MSAISDIELEHEKKEKEKRRSQTMDWAGGG